MHACMHVIDLIYHKLIVHGSLYDYVFIELYTFQNLIFFKVMDLCKISSAGTGMNTPWNLYL